MNSPFPLSSEVTEPTGSPITVFLNGRARQISPLTTLAQLAHDVGRSPNQLLVEVNGIALLRDEWPGRTLLHGDRVEMIQVVAGG